MGSREVLFDNRPPGGRFQIAATAAEGIRMHLSSQRISRGRALAVMAVAALAAAVFGTGLATSSAKPAKRAVSKTVYMRFNGQQIKFVAPDTVRSGADLRVINKTDPQVIGPHSFSLVQRSDLPKTRRARRACFAPGHICREIAKWHGSNGQSPPTKNPAKAGRPGWDRMGSLRRDGDSWFVGRRNASITQEVSARGPERIFFMCAIHPFMQGSIRVLP